MSDYEPTVKIKPIFERALEKLEHKIKVANAALEHLPEGRKEVIKFTGYRDGLEEARNIFSNIRHFVQTKKTFEGEKSK